MQTFFLWFPPDFFPALLLGLISGAGFKLWKYAKGSCLLAPLFWYVYGAWLLSCFITLFANATMLNGFFVGLGLAFIKPLFEILARIYERFSEFQRDRAYRKQERQRQEREQAQQTQQQESTDQVRREREAEAERQRQQRKKQQENTQNHQRQEQQKAPPKEAEPDTRTPEQVLGLGSGWTQDDLLKAYRREAQRLHPDKWADKPQAIREEMEKEFKKVQWAFKILK